uniref:FIP1-like 1 protein n=1 Tax=Acanthochromis polyacanthus TaxID=80966 RepID=A0A3Q1ES68_9TELE
MIGILLRCLFWLFQVQQGRTGNEKDLSSLPVHTSKPDFTSPVNLYKSAVSQVTSVICFNKPLSVLMSAFFSFSRKTSGTIDVIGGQTATISRVEGRRRHNLEGNNIQTITNPYNMQAQTLLFFICPGAYPPPMAGGVPPPWAPIMDNSKPWDYYSRRDDKRDKDRDRPRERTHEREREREHSSCRFCRHSDEERYRYREYPERAYGERHRDRSSREKEERHRERRHREKEEGRHKSSRRYKKRLVILLFRGCFQCVSDLVASFLHTVTIDH